MFIIENTKLFFVVRFLNILTEIYIRENDVTIIFFNDLYKITVKENLSKNKLNNNQIWLFSKEIYDIIKNGIILENFEEIFSHTIKKYFKE